MEVDFVTLGTAAEKLDVAPPTLRNWADKLEEMDVHYLLRNDRDDRLIYDIDMEIFQYIKQQKDLYGRKTTTTDLARVIKNSDDFKKRPNPNPIKENEIDNREVSVSSQFPITSIEELSNHPKFKEMIRVIGEAVLEEQSMKMEQKLEESLDRITEEFKSKITDIENNRIKKMDELIYEQRRTREALRDHLNKPFYKRWFSKYPKED